MTAVTTNPVLVEVTIFGGCRQFNPTTYDDNQLALAETTVLKFGRSTEQMECIPYYMDTRKINYFGQCPL